MSIASQYRSTSGELPRPEPLLTDIETYEPALTVEPEVGPVTVKITPASVLVLFAPSMTHISLAVLVRKFCPGVSSHALKLLPATCVSTVGSTVTGNVRPVTSPLNSTAPFATCAVIVPLTPFTSVIVGGLIESTVALSESATSVQPLRERPVSATGQRMRVAALLFFSTTFSLT